LAKLLIVGTRSPSMGTAIAHAPPWTGVRASKRFGLGYGQLRMPPAPHLIGFVPLTGVNPDLAPRHANFTVFPLPTGPLGVLTGSRWKRTKSHDWCSGGSVAEQ